MNAREMIGVVAASGETAAQTAIRAAFKLGEESMRERCAEECRRLSAEYFDGGPACEAAIRALPTEE